MIGNEECQVAQPTGAREELVPEVSWLGETIDAEDEAAEDGERKARKHGRARQFHHALAHGSGHDEGRNTEDDHHEARYQCEVGILYDLIGTYGGKTEEPHRVGGVRTLAEFEE